MPKLRTKNRRTKNRRTKNRRTKNRRTKNRRTKNRRTKNRRMYGTGERDGAAQGEALEAQRALERRLQRAAQDQEAEQNNQRDRAKNQQDRETWARLANKYQLKADERHDWKRVWQKELMQLKSIPSKSQTSKQKKMISDLETIFRNDTGLRNIEAVLKKRSALDKQSGSPPPLPLQPFDREAQLKIKAAKHLLSFFKGRRRSAVPAQEAAQMPGLARMRDGSAAHFPTQANNRKCR